MGGGGLDGLRLRKLPFFYFISHVIGVIKLLREDLKAFGDTKPNKKEDHGKCTYALNAECLVCDDRSNQQNEDVSKRSR